MKILFIEDEPSKLKDIQDTLANMFEDLDLDVANSYTSGLNKIRNTDYNYLLLDMSLPIYDYSDNFDELNQFETFAGLDILDEMQRIDKGIKTVVISAFDILGENEDKIDLKQLDKQMQSDYADFFLGTIHYNVTSLEWKSILHEYLQIKDC